MTTRRILFWGAVVFGIILLIALFTTGRGAVWT